MQDLSSIWSYISVTLRQWYLWVLIGLYMSGCSILSSPIDMTPPNEAPVANDDTFNLPAKTHITLAWDDSDNISQEVEGYYLYYWQFNWEKSKRVDVGKATTYTLAGLEGGEIYHFAVSVYGTGKRESPHSNVISRRISEYNEGRTRTLTAEAPGVLGNDYDKNGDALEVLLVSNPTQGTVVLLNDGGFTYTPHSHFSGRDRFTYQATDGTRASNVATVTITVDSAAVSYFFPRHFLHGEKMAKGWTDNAWAPPEIARFSLSLRSPTHFK